MLVPSPKTNIQLFPYQLEDVDYLDEERSALLAWEMGTGKTYAAIERDLRIRQLWEEDHPEIDIPPATLVVAPLSTLEDTWHRHFQRLAPYLNVKVIDPKKRADFVRELQKLKTKSTYTHVFICHWESLRLMKDELHNIAFLHVIADEVHRAKNRKTQQTIALKRIPTFWKTGLTGTPIANKPPDLWSILNWLHPQQYRSYWAFYKRYCDFEIQYPQQYHKFIGPKNSAELRERLSGFYRRRLKKNVLKDLPDKYYSHLWVDLHPLQRKAYDQMKKEMIAWLETQDGEKPLPAPVAIAQLIRLQQFSSAYADLRPSTRQDGSLDVVLTEPSSKIDALMELIEDNPDERLVIFSGFKQIINLVARRLKSLGLSASIITGDVSQSDRRNTLRDFRDGKTRYFLGTIGAGGEGIDLSTASTIVFLDRDWSPSKNLQAEDRLHRIGQKNAVHVIDIMSRNTVDIGRFRKLELKKEWIRQVLGD